MKFMLKGLEETSSQSISISKPVLLRPSHLRMRWWNSALTYLKTHGFWSQIHNWEHNHKLSCLKISILFLFIALLPALKCWKPWMLKKIPATSFLSTDCKETSWYYFILSDTSHSGIMAVEDKLSNSYTFSTYWFWFIKPVILEAIVED